MTPAQLEHLRAIDAHLTALLDLAAKRTPGEWKLSSHNTPIGETGDYEGVIQVEATECRQSDPVLCEFWNPDDDEEANFHFIASCAGNAEAGWRSTKASIALLLLIKRMSFSPNSEAANLLESILAAWPIEKLKLP